MLHLDKQASVMMKVTTSHKMTAGKAKVAHTG